jgi:L-asparaginase
MIEKPLLIIHTGGTIGMTSGPTGLVPDKAFAGRLSLWIQRRYPAIQSSIKCHEPLIDSADAASAQWYSIAQKILDSHLGYGGVVVLHGTDTMAYTAGALSFILKGLAKPIILTGAQVPFPNSDAEDNVYGAMLCALDGRIREVCIFFDGTLLRGNRTVKYSTKAGDSFTSPHWPILARSRPRLRIDDAALLKPEPSEPSLPQLPVHVDGVGLIKIYPGLSDRLLLAAAEVHSRGIVLELYGSGTAPALNSTLRSALETLVLQGIPIVGVSQCLRGTISQPTYQSSHVLRDVGVIAGHDLTAEAAFTKLCYLQSIGCPRGHLESAMASGIAGELTIRANDS